MSYSIKTRLKAIIKFDSKTRSHKVYYCQVDIVRLIINLLNDMIAKLLKCIFEKIQLCFDCA
jgi:hypothetical protein